MDTPEILVIEHDDQLMDVLRVTLAAEGYCVREATVAGGVLVALQQLVDVIVLDQVLRDGDYIQVIRRIREANHSVPIIVLAASLDERNKIAALDAGADTFINKPVGMGELLAQIRVSLRRSAGAHRTARSIYRTGDIEVNLTKRRIDVNGREVHLTRKEYKLLEVLIRHADEIVPHNHLLDELWGRDHGQQLTCLRLHMCQLRRKLEADPGRPRYLLTQSGVGYRLATQRFPKAWNS
jgi:two-component system, OmpR family, KDP operon response regulator KdpE